MNLINVVGKIKQLVAFLALVIAFPAGADSNTLPIQQRLTDAQFKSMGLHKLSEVELQRLSDYLKGEVVSEAADLVEEQKVHVDKPRTMRIAGDFSGWRGKTKFTMNNGEVWVQRTSGRYFKRLNSPEVIIEKNTLGFYIMRVPEVDRAVGVKRIK
ncbi:MAG: hypothetical protein OIF38_05750 [Cellvibrionaceae bacterium]|nr:hypothetical protein [Cellvibrionaceae bacterium]